MQQKAHADCLAMLRAQGGVWYVGCGWQWGNSATATVILMRTLERRGLVQRCVTPSRVEWRLPGSPEAVRPAQTVSAAAIGAPGASSAAALAQG